MTITTQAVREMAERLGSWGGLVSSGYECPAAGTAMHEAQTMLLALVEERDMLAEANAKKADDIVTLGQLVGKAEARAEAAEAALRETRAALEPFTTPPLYVLEGEARFVPKKMPGGWIGGGWFSSDDFRRAITAYHRTSHVTLQGRDRDAN